MGPVFRRAGFAMAHPVLTARRLWHGPQAFSAIPWDEISARLHPGDAIVEAGAADGLDTVALAQRFPECQVLACEPVEGAFQLLKSATQGVRHVTPLRVALGASDGVTEIHVARADVTGAADSSSLLAPSRHQVVFPHIEFVGKQSVEIRTLDSLCEEHEIQPRFLWLDVQGSELTVLGASPKARTGCRTIFMEVSRVQLYEGAPTYRYVVRQMQAWGFEVVVNQVGAVAGNILFARP